MSEVVHIRLNAEDAKKFNDAASASKLKLSSWVRQCCHFAAERAMKSAKTM